MVNMTKREDNRLDDILRRVKDDPEVEIVIRRGGDYTRRPDVKSEYAGTPKRKEETEYHSEGGSSKGPEKKGLRKKEEELKKREEELKKREEELKRKEEARRRAWDQREYIPPRYDRDSEPDRGGSYHN